MTRRFLLLSAFILLSAIIEAPRSVAAADPASFVGDLGTRALAATRSGDTAAVREGRFRELFRQGFDVEACARSALGPYWQTATVQQRQEFLKVYEDYVVIGYSTHLGGIGSGSFKVLGSQPDREGFIVKSQITWINGPAPIGVDWQLHATNNGYKVTDLIINHISMANAQRDDLISVIQHNSGQVQALLVALREKNASNGIIQ